MSFLTPQDLFCGVFLYKSKGGDRNDNGWNYTAYLAFNGERLDLRKKIKLN